MSEVTKRRWSDTQKLVVLLSVNKSGYSADVNAKCQVCQSDTLSFERTNVFKMWAWCDNCHTGIQQG